MFDRTGTILAAALFCAGVAHADFTYQETSKITGGAMAGMMKVAGAFSRQAREPIQSTVMVKGNRMVRMSAETTTITDLDQETITTIHNRNRTYSVMTFQQMKEAMERAMAEAQSKTQEAPRDNQADVAMNVTVKDTGQSRVIQGLNTQEKVLTFDIQTTDTRTGQTGTMTVTSDMWVTPDIPGYEEVREFHRRMARKMGTLSAGMNPLGMGRPEVSRAMARLAAEGSKIDGIPVYQVMRMGSNDPQMKAALEQGQQQDQAQRQQAPPPSAGETAAGAIAGRLGRLGGLGGLGRRKSQDSTQQQQQQTPPPSDAPPAQSTPPPEGSAAAAGASLMETTTELSSFSSAPLDASRFTVPAGYKQVENEMERYLRKDR